MLTLILFCLLAYCIGSISSAVLVCRLAGLPDPRSSGSKNPGATNVLRMGGKKAAIATLLGDVIKGVIPVVVAMQFDPRPEFVGPVMLAVFLGHLYPIFFNFQGGKGVATAIGAILALSWPAGLIVVGVWLLIFLISRISSLSALIAAALAPFCVGCLVGYLYAVPVAVMTLFLFWRHRSNVKRLLEGTEPKFGSQKTKTK
jgi:glycerol-3-phosphate acyltransferase PlsY